MNSDITKGIIIAIVGVALIIISPNLSVNDVPFAKSGKDVQDAALAIGVILLIVGGIISATELGSKKAIPLGQQLHGIFLYHNGQLYGPYQVEAIMEWYKAGKLSENDMVFNKGSNQYVPVASFLGMNNSTITSPASNTTSSLDELEKLASLKEKGLITEEEYEKKKKQILGI